MTREEAIDYLTILGGIGNITANEAMALEMAIEALEQETCKDVVSRQAVKEEMIKYGFHALDMTVTEFVEDLPSVQPMRKRGKWKGTDEWYHRCSNCKEVFHFYIGEYIENNNWNICPNCGSYNREDGE